MKLKFWNFKKYPQKNYFHCFRGFIRKSCTWGIYSSSTSFSKIDFLKLKFSDEIQENLNLKKIPKNNLFSFRGFMIMVCMNEIVFSVERRLKIYFFKKNFEMWSWGNSKNWKAIFFTVSDSSSYQQIKCQKAHSNRFRGETH